VASSASGIARGERAPRPTARKKRAICPALAISDSHAWAVIGETLYARGGPRTFAARTAPGASDRRRGNGGVRSRSEVEPLPAPALVDERLPAAHRQLPLGLRAVGRVAQVVVEGAGELLDGADPDLQLRVAERGHQPLQAPAAAVLR